jgi:hypothetical protein
MFGVYVSFFISVHLCNTDLPPLRGGRVFKPVPEVKTPALTPFAPSGQKSNALPIDSVPVRARKGATELECDSPSLPLV